MGFQQQIRMKPALEIYRPPSKNNNNNSLISNNYYDYPSDIRMDIPQNKLNVHAQEFTMGMQNNMGNNR
jgi:hypothetical protein